MLSNGTDLLRDEPSVTVMTVLGVHRQTASYRTEFTDASIAVADVNVNVDDVGRSVDGDPEVKSYRRTSDGNLQHQFDRLTTGHPYSNAVFLRLRRAADDGRVKEVLGFGKWIVRRPFGNRDCLAKFSGRF